jgi:hypothetical protein
VFRTAEYAGLDMQASAADLPVYYRLRFGWLKGMLLRKSTRNLWGARIHVRLAIRIR